MVTDMEKEQREKMRFSSGIESKIRRLDFQRERILKSSPENEAFSTPGAGHDADFYMVLLRRLYRWIEAAAKHDSRVANLKGKSSALCEKIKIRDHFEHFEPEADYEKIPQITPGIIVVGGVVTNDTNPHIISGDQKWLLNEDHEEFKNLLGRFVELYPFADKPKQKTRPDILYKYVPAKRIDILSQKRIRFSSLEDLNDPLECRPLVGSNPNSTMKRALAEVGDEHLAAKKAEGFQDFVRERGTALVRSEVNKKFGVLSLAADPLQPVMWGQYAGSYTGFLIGFDPSHDWFYGRTTDGGREQSVYPVTYAKSPPLVEIGERDDVDHNEFMKGVIFTKGEAWAFEREWRAINSRTEALPPEQCGGYTDLHRLPEDVVVEVVLGPLMDAEIEKKIRSLVNTDFPRATVRRLTLPTTSYLLKIE